MARAASSYNACAIATFSSYEAINIVTKMRYRFKTHPLRKIKGTILETEPYLW